MIDIKNTKETDESTKSRKYFKIAFLGNGEGNGNPLQYSCLENPVGRGGWWAAVPRVTQTRTQLKRLSMHACILGNKEPINKLKNQGKLNIRKFIHIIHDIHKLKAKVHVSFSVDS